MRLLITTLSALCFAFCGCATNEHNSLGYSDYAALSCDELKQQAAQLARQASDRSEYFLQNDGDRLDRAHQQLRLVKQVRSEKACHGPDGSTG
jgi:hypothetical protein